MLFIITSCKQVYYTTSVGTITTFKSNGDTLNHYTNVIIQTDDNISPLNNIFKKHGLNFFDKTTNKYIIIPYSMPYIIEYVVLSEEYFEERNKLIVKYNKLKQEHKDIIDKIKILDPNSLGYKQFLSVRSKLEEELERIKQELKNTYSFNIQ